MTTKSDKSTRIKLAAPRLLKALKNIINDADDAGCVDVYVVHGRAIDSARRLLDSLENRPAKTKAK